MAIPASANDSTASIGLGGVILLKQADIAMETEDLMIGPDKVEVAYRFRNRSDKDIDATVAFPMPRISVAATYYEDQAWPNRESENLIDFAVSADGVAVPAISETRAFVKDTDVTDELRALGVALGHSMDWQVETKAAQPLGPRFLVPIAGGELWPTWDEQTTFHWSQRFPAGKPVRIEHRYVPAAGYQHFTGDGDLSKYCFDKQDEAEIRRLAARDGERLQWEGETLGQLITVDYILTTANNWRGPIGDFSLALKGSSPAMMIASCFPGLKRGPDNTLILHRDSFWPTTELQVSFLMLTRH